MPGKKGWKAKAKQQSFRGVFEDCLARDTKELKFWFICSKSGAKRESRTSRGIEREGPSAKRTAKIRD